MLSPTSSVISAGMVMSFSLITFMPSCSPSALSTWSSFARPIRTATLPSSSVPDRFCSSRIFQRDSSSRYPMSTMIVPIRRAMPEHPSLDQVRGDRPESPLGIPREPDCVMFKDKGNRQGPEQDKGNRQGPEQDKGNRQGPERASPRRGQDQD